MSEDKEAQGKPKRISSMLYFIMGIASLAVSVPLFLFVHPVAAVSAVVIGIFLLTGGFFSMASERRWLD